MEIELERTFLLKNKPKDLEKYKSVEILDIYFPYSAEHPILRLRKSGNIYELTKKQPLKGLDSSEQTEETISLSKQEFEEFSKLKGKRLRKIRYYYLNSEIDFFLDELEGLVLVDFEFKEKEKKNDFKMPDYCLKDITQEKFCAGGILAGKKYSDIELFLKKHNYKKIYLNEK